jgi:hypothetical protein
VGVAVVQPPVRNCDASTTVLCRDHAVLLLRPTAARHFRSEVAFGTGSRGYASDVEDSVDLELPHDSSAPAIARRALARWGANADADVAVSELVTNAVQHGKPPIRLYALRTWDVIHIEVHDEGQSFGEPKIDSVGLRLVEAFTTAWGVAHIPNDGTIVWAEFEP